MKMVCPRRNTGSVKRQAAQQRVPCALQVLQKGLFNRTGLALRSVCETMWGGKSSVKIVFLKEEVGTGSFLVIETLLRHLLLTGSPLNTPCYSAGRDHTHIHSAIQRPPVQPTSAAPVRADWGTGAAWRHSRKHSHAPVETSPVYFSLFTVLLFSLT